MNKSSIEVGHVISVSGSRVQAMMVFSQDETLAQEMAIAAQIGSMIKLVTPSSMVFGMINSISIKNPSSPPSPDDQRLMEIDLLGETLDYNEEGAFSFQRGVSIYPGLGAPVLSTTLKDLAQVYARPRKSFVRIGTIRQADCLAAYVSSDELVGHHFAILGNTGTGKSCAVTSLLRAILKSHPQGHVVVLDPHDEYTHAFGEAAEVVTAGELKLPYWLLNFEEACETLCSPEEQHRATEAAILKDALLVAKGEAHKTGRWDGPLTVDTPIPYRLEVLGERIKTSMGKLNRPENAQPYLRLMARIDNLRKDNRYAFMFSGLLAQDNMADIMAQTLRVPVAGKPVTIFPLSGLPSEIVDVVVSLLCRMIFDFALWSQEDQRLPVLVICEEAHRYVPRDSSLGFGSTRRILTRIAKEGRKYGVSLGLVTQRPTEISEVILSQCNTIFAMRLGNDKDQAFVKFALPENTAGLITALSALRNQESIVVGEGVSLPMLVRFDDLDEKERPQSGLYRVSQAWQEDRWTTDFVHKTVDRWRRQNH